jgi:hypothetical protein
VVGVGSGLTGRGFGLVPKLVRREKLVELRPGEVTETEVACIERDEQAATADLGLRLAETKQLMGHFRIRSCRRRASAAAPAFAGRRTCRSPRVGSPDR